LTTVLGAHQYGKAETRVVRDGATHRLRDLNVSIAEIRCATPNKHHFLVDLTHFELDNPDEVYFAADRPYGLIEGAVLRDDVPAAEEAWWSS
jgi:urate oxidase